MLIREAVREDLPALLELYTHLNPEEAPPPPGPGLNAVWERILEDKNQHLLVGEEAGVLISSCVLVVVPNLTRGPRPYALVENVVTHRQWRGRGCATRLLHHARALAQGQGCYKLMLLTGSKEAATLRFYEKAGYNRQDKTGFVQWLE